MTDTRCAKLRVSHIGGVATGTIDNPPVTVLNVELKGEMRDLIASVRKTRASEPSCPKAPTPSSSSPLST